MKRFLLLSLAVLMALLACGKARPAVIESPLPSSTPQVEMQRVQGRGVQLLLPLSYVEHDIHKSLPALQEDFRKGLGEQPGPLGNALNSIVDNLGDSIAYWGYEDGSRSAQSTDLLILQNRELAKLPLGIVLPLIEKTLSARGLSVTRDSLKLADRDTERFSYSDGSYAVAVYVFTAADELYLAIFSQSPDHLATQLAVFDQILNSLQIDAPSEGG